jgi:hypothetical protein
MLKEMYYPQILRILSKGKARMYGLSSKLKPKIHRHRIIPGVKGFLIEGNRKVAEAEVVKTLGLKNNTH